jgi:hypothetical protein
MMRGKQVGQDAPKVIAVRKAATVFLAYNPSGPR